MREVIRRWCAGGLRSGHASRTFYCSSIFGAAVGSRCSTTAGRGCAGRLQRPSGDITYALVGIAGSFMGYHIAGILGIAAPILLYILAVAGAALTVYLWRGR